MSEVRGQWGTARVTAVALVLLAYSAGHFAKLSLPPLGRDAWRETDVLIVGRNYCIEQTPFWLPRVDARLDKTGITGMEFPVLNWVEGKLACAGIDQILIGRTVGFIATLLAIVAIGLLSGGLSGTMTPLLTTAAFAGSPIIWYYGVAIQPDMPSLALILWAMVFALRSAESGVTTGRGTLLLAASAITASLGILIKLPVIVYGLPILVMLVGALGWKRSAREWRLWVYAAVALVPAWLWYRYARYLQVKYGLETFFLGKSFGALMHDWSELSFYRSIFLQKLFGYYVFGGIAVAALLGFTRYRAIFPAWLKALGLATLSYVFLTGHHTAHHFYYGVPMVPALALGGGAALGAAVDRLSEQRRPIAGAALALGLLIYGWAWIKPWWGFSNDVPAYNVARTQLDQVVPRDRTAMLISGGDPKLLWFMNRKGWLSAGDHLEWFQRYRPDLPVILLDRRAGRINEAREALQVEFRGAGYRELLTSDAIEIWVKP